MEIDYEAHPTIQHLSEEILIHILHFLDEKSLCSCAYVCKQWLHTSTDGQMWRRKLATPSSLQPHLARKGPSGDSKPRLFSTNVKALNNDFKRLFFEFRKLDSNMSLPIIQEGIEASSTDHPEQGISKTLDENESTFWSSTGSEDTMKGEHLIYKLVQPVCIVSLVSILPYMAAYQQGMPIYAPQQIQISVGFSPKVMHWSSPIFDVENKHDIQTFHVLPQVVVGGYVRLDLLGRYQTQPNDDLYYTVLETVKIQGFPVGAISNNILSSAFIDFALEQNTFLEQIKENYKANKEIQTILNSATMNKADLSQILLLTLNKEILPVLNKQSEVKKALLNIVEIVKKGDYKKAAKLIGQSDSQIRNNGTFALFLQSGPQALKDYFGEMLKLPSRLTKLESIELMKVLLENRTNMPFINLLFHQQRFTMCQEIGDMVRQFDVALAIRIYLMSSVPDKIIECYKQLKQWNKVIHFCTTFKYKVDYLKMLKEIHEKSPGDALQFAVTMAEQKGGSPVELDDICKVLCINTGDEWDLRKVLRRELEEQAKKGVVSPPQEIEGDLDWEEEEVEDA